MRDLIVLAVVGAGTYALRAAFLLTADARPPALLERFLPYVAPAVLAAIAVPGLLAPRGIVSVGETLPAVVAAAVTWLLWARFKQLPVALIGGLALWWLLEAVTP
ncbi:AzlD domain-containing protein [Agromyces sp. H66]|uniref:AzlD domain-containing protein n=1 Tax=Agromyces sp. H66 TaxID=2529859 RepID=UPI0010AA46C9|nr:AzlD domain-containing protein [Agromyces sp. H66]